MRVTNMTIDYRAFIPNTQKTIAKKTVQAFVKKCAMHAGEKVVSTAGAKVLSTTAAKTCVRASSKIVAKRFFQSAANPMLLVADGVDLAVRNVCRRMALDEDTSRAMGKGSGFVSSIGIGAAVGGPVGAAAGLAFWGVGEGISALFDLAD